MCLSSKTLSWRRSWIALFAFLVSAIASPTLQASGVAQSANQEGQQSVEVLRSIAESQFEIVKLLIKQGRYDRVLPEMRKIYELNLPEQFEQAVAESASLAAHMSVQAKQFGLAHDILSEALLRMKSDKNKASLLKIQAYVFNSEGKYSEALEALERAVAIERRLIRP